MKKVTKVSAPEYREGSTLHTLYSRLAKGRPVAPGTLFKGIDNGVSRLHWVRLHGKSSGQWQIERLENGSYLMKGRKKAA